MPLEKVGSSRFALQPKLTVKGFGNQNLAESICAFVSELTDLKLCTSSPSWLCLKNSLDGKSGADALQRKKKRRFLRSPFRSWAMGS